MHVLNTWCVVIVFVVFYMWLSPNMANDKNKFPGSLALSLVCPSPTVHCIPEESTDVEHQTDHIFVPEEVWWKRQ